MISNLKTNRILWLFTGLLVLVTSVAAVLYPSLYDGILDSSILPGTTAQDIMAVIVSLVVIGLSLRSNESMYKSYLVIIGCLGFFFYAYMIYSIERIYTVFYYAYLAIVGCSFYGIVYTIASIDPKVHSSILLPRGVKRFSSGYNLFSAIVFTAIWVSQLIPIIKTATKPEFLYSIYIIDLCFILPALVISGVLALRGVGFGVSMLLPSGIVGFSILAPLWLSELMKPVFYGLKTSFPEMSLFLVVSTIFLASAVLDYRGFMLQE